MPDTPFLVAAIAVLAAIVSVVWVNRRGDARSNEQQAIAARARSELAETQSRLTETQNRLAAARSEVDQVTEQLGQVRAEMETIRTPAAHADGRHVEVFVNLSRRLQSLVHREIKLLDALENEVEDPDLLKGLFQVDHLATRIRRHAENLAVLGGSVSRRQWSRPVALTEVLRSAIAEVEHYSRVKLVPPIEGTVPGHAVASVIHLVAELIENATMFAPPHTHVLLRTQQVTAGVAIEVEDRGLGMQRPDQDRANQLLSDPNFVELDDLLRDGRIGLYVVSVIARQHGIIVRLQTNIYGGTQAVVILPRLLIGSPPPAAVPAAGPVPPALESPAPALPATARLPAVTSPALLRAPAAPPVGPAQVSPAAVAPLHSDPGFGWAGNSAPTAAYPQTTSAVPEQAPPRPPLPRRHSQSHMAPQLKLGPSGPATDLGGEHNPGLMASFLNGVSQAEAHSSSPDSHG
ncbi:MAG TPA: ATP-binding protein [Actinoplanes sp.]|nr:ATP-binding protein [Actinoplanes sp.]